MRMQHLGSKLVPYIFHILYLSPSQDPCLASLGHYFNNKLGSGTKIHIRQHFNAVTHRKIIVFGVSQHLLP